MRCESGRHVKRRVAPTIRAAIDVHRVREMTAANLAVIAHYVAAIERIRSCESSRLKSVGANDCVRSTENLREELVALLHLSGVIMDERVRGQELSHANGVRVLRSIVRRRVGDAPCFGKAFKVRHPGLRQRFDSLVPIIESDAAAARINHAMQRQSISRIEQVQRYAGWLFDRRAPEFIIRITYE